MPRYNLDLLRETLLLAHKKSKLITARAIARDMEDWKLFDLLGGALQENTARLAPLAPVLLALGDAAAADNRQIGDLDVDDLPALAARL